MDLGCQELDCKVIDDLDGPNLQLEEALTRTDSDKLTPNLA